MTNGWRPPTSPLLPASFRELSGVDETSDQFYRLIVLL
jgi:hypothetical protein